jgi:hypothetical protein
MRKSTHLRSLASVTLFSLALLCCRNGSAAVFDILITDNAAVTRIVLDRDLTFTVDGNNLVLHIPDTSVDVGDNVTTDGTGDNDGTDNNDENDGDTVTEGSEDPDSTGVNEGEGVTDGSENPDGTDVTDGSNITDETDGNLSSEANDAEDESEGQWRLIMQKKPMRQITQKIRRKQMNQKKLFSRLRA